MIAALSARQAGHDVILLERQARAGRKLMASGNGRCNLSNMNAGRGGYHGEEPGFIRPALVAFSPQSMREYFRGLGLLTVEEADGRVYPLSNSANSVVDVLRYALEAAGVELRVLSPVKKIRRAPASFVVVTDECEFRSDALIVACGGMAGEKLGGVKDGYELLKALGHSRTTLHPALVQITTGTGYPRSLKGVKADCALTLREGGRETAKGGGELLFTENGVSGPAAFDLSRAVSTAGDRQMELEIDLLRAYAAGEVYSMLCDRRGAAPELQAGELFTGALHNRLGRMVVKYAQLDANARLAELSDKDIARAVESCKQFTLPVRGTESFKDAQVTVGGIKTSEFDAKTLESRIVPGLFACGEVLDVDGDCGGYNLQWAWSSGRLAGRLGK